MLRGMLGIHPALLRVQANFAGKGNIRYEQSETKVLLLDLQY
jgi:hypothetical protein